MPKALRYGMIIAAILGLLFLVAYVFRDYLLEWFWEFVYLVYPEGVLRPDTGNKGNIPFG